jgi:tocopherol cyclase
MRQRLRVTPPRNPGGLITRLRNLWRPQNFHLHHRLRRGGGHFEGWYFKLVDAEGRQPYAIIPGVFLGASDGTPAGDSSSDSSSEEAHAFVQVLDGRAGRAAYHRFALEEFRADSERFAIEVAGSHFGVEGLHLDIPDTGAGPGIRGSVRFTQWRPWPVTATSPGVMGPYSFVPFMECNHGILSLDHALEGALVVDGRETAFDGGRGYVEKDWGKRFPSGYVWTQSNHFDEEGICLTASVARIPWLTGAFRGFLAGILHEGELYRFTTYNGGEIESLTLSDTHLHLRLRNREHRLEVDSRKAEGGVLHAPYEGAMIERVAETMSSEMDVRLSSLGDGRTLFEGRGRHACLETQGDLHFILDDGAR